MSEAEIRKRNRAIMNSARPECGMQWLVQRESMSGNAAPVVIRGIRYDCVGANFYYDLQTGEILCFSNRNLTYEKKFGVGQGTFKIALLLKEPEREFMKIITMLFDERASKAANRMLRSSADIFNAEHSQAQAA